MASKKKGKTCALVLASLRRNVAGEVRWEEMGKGGRDENYADNFLILGYKKKNLKEVIGNAFYIIAYVFRDGETRK